MSDDLQFPTYESLGVRPLINCKGTYTIISGSVVLPEVRQAMYEASQRYVDLDELMEGVGTRSGELMQCEWGLGTNGCAAALCQVTAACGAGTARYLEASGSAPSGSISLLITGDEEGPSINGTRKVLGWMAENGETLDACIVGEPTNPEALGDMVKIGRRGSLNAKLTVSGTQGHAAYPHLADNPVPRLIAMLHWISTAIMDEGTDHFQPSNIEVTSVDVGNPATNVIPAEARALFNIRFNDLHTSDSLINWLREGLDTVGGDYTLSTHVTGEAFLTPPGPFSEMIVESVRDATGRTPELSTTGGTSDARFIKDYCPVAEFGLAGKTMHKVDEGVPVSDLEALAEIYRGILARYFTN